MSTLRALILVTVGWEWAASGSPETGRRQTQTAAAGDGPTCARLVAELGSLACDNAGVLELCPEACAAAADVSPPAPPAWCAQAVGSGELTCGSFTADLCPEACAAAPPNAIAAEYRWSCPVLLRLDAGCAHDLSRDDPSVAAGTRVSDVCPGECSGRSGCAPTALDASFLGVMGDGSGNAHGVTLAGDACADGGGLQLSGEGFAQVSMGGSYAEGGDFSLAFWLLKAREDVWAPEGGAHSEYIFSHPIDEGSADSDHAGIDVRLSREAWLDVWSLRVGLDHRYERFTLDLLRDATPKWTHVTIVVDETLVSVFENGQARADQLVQGPNPGFRAAASILARSLTIGAYLNAYGPAMLGFRGSFAMLQIYPTALTTDELHCVYESGRQLVHSGRMASLSASDCRQTTSTGCTSPNADNGHALGSDLQPDIDDGSCTFEPQPAREGEHGLIHVTDDWQSVALAHSYTKPVVICGVVTRKSTTAAIVRMRQLKMDSGGTWRFEIRAEQKQCHFATPPPTAEGVSFLVVEAGVSTEGWQAGVVRVRDRDWHRVSLAAVPSGARESDSSEASAETCCAWSFREVTDVGSAGLVRGPWGNDGIYNRDNPRVVATAVPIPAGVTQCEVSWRSWAVDSRDGETDSVEIDGTEVWSQAPRLWGRGCTDGWRQGQSDFPHNPGMQANGLPLVCFSDVAVTVACSGGSLSIRFLSGTDQAESDEAWAFSDVAISGRRTDGSDWTVRDATAQDAGVANDALLPVVVSQVQTYDNRTDFVTSRQHQPRSVDQPSAFFLQVQGEGVWCQDGEFFAEYFDSLDLSGNPMTQCEVEVPHWHWHASSQGIPPPLLGTLRTMPRSELFSARWTVRLRVVESGGFIFSSLTNRGSRIIVDGTTVLDVWSEWGSTFSSEPVPLGPGYSIIAYEYRSGYDTDYTPSDSFAELSWSVGSETFGSVSGSNSTNVTSTADELYVDVGWLACSQGNGSIHGSAFQSGLVAGDEDLATSIYFASAFADPPRVFGSIASVADLSSHLRLSETDKHRAAVAIEYDTCDAVFANAEASVAWIAVAALPGQGMRVAQAQTLSTDTQALLAIATALRLPAYFHWRNGSDPCSDRWTGIECRTDAAGTPRIIVLDISDVDLTNQDVPWTPIGHLTALEEISMWNCGLTGVIDAEALCRLTALQVLALRQNKLHGTVPECMATLPLEWLWLEDNNFHGPLPELSLLGQFLKSIPSRSLKRNRWTPLLASEKRALEDVSQPLGVETHEHGHDWDFGFSYEWEWASGAEDNGLTATREVSYRQWSGGVPFEGFYTKIAFSFPVRAGSTSTVAIGRDGDLAVVGNYLPSYGDNSEDSSAWGQKQYMGCYRDENDGTCGATNTPPCRGVKDDDGEPGPGWWGMDDGNWQSTERSDDWVARGYPVHETCASHCADYQYYGLQYTIGCLCGNTFGQYGEGTDCGTAGEFCGTNQRRCGGNNAVFAQAAWRLQSGETDESMQRSDSSCWSTLPALVSNVHAVSELAADRSSQGEAYFAQRFCSGWSSFIYASCDPDQQTCDKDTATLGNAIFDGGDDMYDIGNLLVTSLMGDCTNDPHDCALGSLEYRSDFSPVPTNCFGPGGQYQMQQLDGMWVFFTTNVNDSPIDFTVMGNLGADGTGMVTEFVIDVPPFTGFVKRECGDADGDPSVNHMIIVDSGQGRPIHSCDYANGGECTGADSNLDDDVVSGIAPGSPILYLLYSTEGGSCMKEDEHRAIFDQATLCIRAADPFSALNRGHTAASHVLVEVDVDDAGHILFGGTAPYAGWTRGSPRHVSGPSGFPNALQFSGREWLQLGDEGVQIEGNWTLDCWVQVDGDLLRGMGEIEGVLVESVDAIALASLRWRGQRVELGGEAVAGAWRSSGEEISAGAQSWVRLTVRAARVSSQTTYSYFVDGQLTASVQLDAASCGDALCAANFFAIGGRSDGTAPFPLPIHRLRVFGDALSPAQLDSTGLAVGDLLRYQPENSRTVRLSRGTDALDVTWDTFGWNAAAHGHVHATLDSHGGVRLRCDNVSQLWDRAVASASGIAAQPDASNWTSAALGSDASVGLRVRYIDSDACFDLWNGVTCSLSDWPVGTDDCAERLDCEALGWPADAYGSSSVCGSSTLVGEFGSSDMCVRERTYAEADSLCREMGGRLCTATELEQGEGDPAACSYDSIFRWSWVSTTAEACPNNNQSLGMAGRPGAWFSFVPTVLSAFYEFQLHSAHALDGDSFTILGVFDDHAEMVAGRPATLHHREDGAMLRWNSTMVSQHVFVHVSSSVIDAHSTMTVVLPPQYSWRRVVDQASPFGASALVLPKDGAVRVELSFDFPFFGLQRRQLWVSSFGMVLFEAPRDVDSPFGGVGNTHSAIMAAAGEYDLSRAGASVTTLQRSPTELEVAWHAPLFSSNVFTDVAVVLNADGAAVIRWDRIDLSAGGSLGHSLECLLSFDAAEAFQSVEDMSIVNQAGEAPATVVGTPFEADGTRPGAYSIVPSSNAPAISSYTQTDTAYRWTDVPESAVTLARGDWVGGADDGYVAALLPFEFPYFGRVYSHVLISTNGILSFGDNIYRHEFGDIPVPNAEGRTGDVFAQSSQQSVHNLLAVLWTDLNLETGGSVTYHNTTDSFVISFVDVPFYGVAAAKNSFWCELHRSGEIVMTYAAVDTREHPGSLSIGYEDSTGQRGAQIAFGWDAAPASRSSVRITPAATSAPHQDSSPALWLRGAPYVQLPPMTLGESLCVAAWVRSGPLAGENGPGTLLFSSFQTDACGDSDACRNRDGETLNRGGWVAIGNDPEGQSPSDLWGAGIVFNQATARDFWQSDEWRFVVVSISGREASVYADGLQLGVGQLTTRLPRMLRHNNYVGATHSTPFVSKFGASVLGIRAFRLYDRSLSSSEAAALFDDSAAECCIAAGMKDAFGASDLDLTAQAMAGVQAVAITPAQAAQTAQTADTATGCSLNDRSTTLELDICGEITAVSDCDGAISDGFGPYANSLDCGLRLEGFVGSTYTLTFEEFETEQGNDFLSVYDGDSDQAPHFVQLSGKAIPAPIVSTGRSMFLRFTSNDNSAAVGFRATFRCAGTLVEYWKPADVAMPLEIGAASAPVAQGASNTECLSGVLMSVQCCADAAMSCSNSRATEIGLSGQNPGLRGSIPDEMGSLGALRSLKLHDNFLTGTLPTALRRLHLLRDLQLSHNQFEMQDRESLAAILGGLIYLKTLDLGMSNEKEDFGKTIVQPTPPLICRVGDVCSLMLSTRTADGVQLPHGGVQMSITKTGDSCACVDQMDGTYECIFPEAWTSRKGQFDFVLSQGGEEFVPVRTLVDPSTGAESVVNTYSRLGVIVPPILCQQEHSHPNDEGAECMCEAGYYRNQYEGGWSCDHCVRGEMPVDEGTRCESCPFGKFSSSGQGCDDCPPGQEPNLDFGADDCMLCPATSISTPGSKCKRCDTGQVADENRTKCICPAGSYNSSAFGDNVGHMIQCVADYRLTDLADIAAPSLCMSCSGLPCVQCTGEEIRVNAGWSVSGSKAAPSATPWFVFQCPEESACLNGETQKCREGHEGHLCNVCEDDYGMLKGLCDRCSLVNSSMWTPLVLLVAVCALVALIYACRRRASSRVDGPGTSSLELQLTDNPLQSDSSSPGSKRSSLSLRATVQRSDDAFMLVRVLYQPVRILIGYGQVVNQIDVVLNIEFGPMIRSMFDVLSLLAINLKSILQIDCLSDLSFYGEWIARVFVVPLVAVLVAALRYAYVVRTRPDAAEDAAGSFRSSVFFIVFIVYPGVCNEAFSMYNCRDLDGDIELLRTDYRVHCDNSEHHLFQLLAGVLIVLFAVGIPLWLVVMMLRRMGEHSVGSDSDRFVARRVADELKIDDKQAMEAIHDVSTGREYSFLVNAYKSQYYYWEGVDMLRKLALVGMLVVVGRGSAAQLFLAVCLSCTALMLQVTLQPYKHWEDNVFKALVEVHIFLVMAVSLVLKFLNTSAVGDQEALSTTFYDWILVASFVAAVPVGFVCTVCAKRSMMRASLHERAVVGEDEESMLQAKQRAVRLLHLGLTSNDDMRLLSAYFGRLENMVNKWSHVFISYRVAADRDLARRLYDELSALTIEETGQKLRVYLDQERLEDGQRWDSGFMEGLAKSWVFVPIVSVGSVRPMLQLSDESDWCDNVLLEWTAALELHQRGRVKSVLPLLASQNSFFGDAKDAFGGIDALPTHVSAATMEQVTMHLQETTGDSSVTGLGELLQQASGQPEPTVQGVVQSLLKFQGIKVTESGAGAAHGHGQLSVGMADLSECLSRVQGTVSACLKRVGMEDSGSGGGASAGSQRSSGKASALSRLGSRLASTVSSGKGGEWEQGGEGGMEIQFGGAEGGDGGGGGGGLYLASS